MENDLRYRFGTYGNFRVLLRASVIPYSAALWILLVLFALRVAGQAIEFWLHVPWLPPIEEWQGSRLPYGYLLTVQLGMLVAMSRIAWRHSSGQVQRRRQAGGWLLGLGTIYLATMLMRLAIGIADLSPAPWFHKPVPAIFHVVLATFVLILAAFHLGWLGDRRTRSGEPS